MNPTNRNLRLGIVYEGRIVREALIDRQADVSLGRTPGATVHLASLSAAPERQDVLLWAHGAWFLVLPDDPLAPLQLRGVAQQPVPVVVRGRRCVPLDGTAGGSVLWGEVTLLFQFVAAGAPMTVTRDRAVLRIGLVLADRLLTERIFDQPGEVVIGTSAKATMVLPAEEYPGPPAVLTRLRDGTVRLRCHAGADLALAGQSGPAAPARREGERLDTVLPVGARARLRLGPYTLLVQVVLAQQAVAVAPRRNIAVRLWNGLTADRTWAASLLAAVLLVGLIVGQSLAHHQRVGRFLTDTLPDETLRQTDWVPSPPPPEPPPEVVPAHTAPLAPPDAPAPSPTAHKSAPRQGVHSAADPEAPGRNRRSVVHNQTAAGAFRGANGAAVSLFQPGDAADAAGHAAFGNGNPDGAGSAPGASTLELAPPTRAIGTIERVPVGPSTLGPRTAAAPAVIARPEKVVVIKLLPDPDGPKPGDDLGTTVGKLAARKQSAVRRCYEVALRDDAELDGKVTVRFVVGTAGSVTEVEVLGASGAFESCIHALFQNLRGLPELPQPRSFRQAYVFSKS